MTETPYLTRSRGPIVGVARLILAKVGLGQQFRDLPYPICNPRCHNPIANGIAALRRKPADLSTFPHYRSLAVAFVNLIWPLLTLTFGPTWGLVSPAVTDASS